jgi:Ser/Thr protein kinase RdoA (MazF antagonist)
MPNRPADRATDRATDHAAPHTPPPAHAYEALTPEVVQSALAALGLHGDGRLMALSSYENRVYQIYLCDALDGQHAVVAKFYRPGRWSDAQIQEEHDFAHELAHAEVPIVAPLELHGATLHHHAGFAFSLSPRRGGRRPELDDEQVLQWLGRFLARIHNVGAARPFAQRPALSVQSFGIDSRDWLLAHEALPLDVQSPWLRTCNEALQIATEIIAERADSTLASGQFHSNIRLHGDCHPGNILWTPQGPHFVDLDDARSGPAVQDLWMLLDGERAQRDFQLSCLLEGYEQLRRFDRRELRLIEPLRTLRLIHYSAWLARRWSDPAFVHNFPWFGSNAYWQEQVSMLQAQIQAMQDPANLQAF